MKLKKLASLALAGTLTLGLLPALSSPALAADGDSTYTLTIPSTLNVANSGWNATSGISATGTLANGKKLTVTAASTNNWALKSGDNSVGYKLATASTDTEATISWKFTELSSTATTKPLGIIVEDYSAKPAGTYTDTVTFTASVESAAVAVTGIELNKTSLELKEGGTTETLTATVSPDNATDKTVTWSSDNEAVATVSDGIVTPVAAGTANITATAGDKTAACTVTVKQLYSITLTGPYTGDTLVMEYYEGDTWNDMVTKYGRPLRIRISGYMEFGGEGLIYESPHGGWVLATAQIDPTKNYEVL